MRKKCMCIIIALSISLLPAMAQKTVSTVEIERQIFELTNKERKARGLEPLTFNSSLAELAHIQSHNMLKHGFFSHTDHQGRSPGDRKDIYFPKLLGGVGENIAYIYGISPKELAQKFMEEWMNSPG